MLLNIRGTSPDTISGNASRSSSMVPIFSDRKDDTLLSGPSSSSWVLSLSTWIIAFVSSFTLDDLVED